MVREKLAHLEKVLLYAAVKSATCFSAVKGIHTPRRSTAHTAARARGARYPSSPLATNTAATQAQRRVLWPRPLLITEPSVTRRRRTPVAISRNAAFHANAIVPVPLS